MLREDGVIFVSIDDNEVHHLRIMMNEIFGEGEFVANVIWEKKFSPQNDAKWLSNTHDYIICFARDKDIWRPNLLARTSKQNDRYSNPDNDPRGDWTSSDFSVKTYSPEYDYPITTPSGKIIELPPGRCWMTSKKKMKELQDDNRLFFGKTGGNVPRLKRFLSEVKQGITPVTILYRNDVGDTQMAKKDLLSIMPENMFDTPKPVSLIKHLLKISTKPNDLILDFFAGSGTTGQAVMELNEEDGKECNRQFILVQLPEEIDKKKEAYKAGYKKISDITIERVKRAGDKYPNVDTGFKVLKLTY